MSNREGTVSRRKDVSALVAARNDAVQAASEVAKHWSHGVIAIVNCGVAAYGALRSLNADGIATFINELERLRVLSRKEARQGIHSPKLIKLRKIGEAEPLLTRPEIARLLPPSYTTIYQLAVLHDQLGADETVTVERVVELAERNAHAEAEETQAAITRELLIRETAAVKKAKRQPKRADAAREAPLSQSTLIALIETKAEFDLVAMDVTGRRAFLGNDYSPGSRIPDCLPVFKVVGEPRAIVVRAKLSDLAAVETVLLPACGFRRAPEVILLRQPEQHRVTDAEIVIAAQEMGEQPAMEAFQEWLPNGTSPGLLEIADWHFPDAPRRLHLFARESTEGWTCLDEASSWMKEPTL